MSYSDHILMTERLSHFEALAQRQQQWTHVRQALKNERGQAPRRIALGLGALRSRARRGVKGRRSLA